MDFILPLLSKVCELPVAAVTNHHKLRGFKQQRFALLQFCSSEVCSESCMAGIKVTSRLLEAPEVESVPCLFELLMAASFPWSAASCL